MANTGIAPLDPTTPVGQVRLLLGDTDPQNITFGQGTYLWYSDDELAALVALYNTSVFRTAVRILRNIAASESLKLKKWSSAQLAVDGAAITMGLTELANSIEADDRYGVMIEASEYVQVMATGGRDRYAEQARTNDEKMWLFRTGFYSGVWPDIYAQQDYLFDTAAERADWEAQQTSNGATWDETNGLI